MLEDVFLSIEAVALRYHVSKRTVAAGCKLVSCRRRSVWASGQCGGSSRTLSPGRIPSLKRKPQTRLRPAMFSDVKIRQAFNRRERAENRQRQLAEQIRSLGNRHRHWSAQDRAEWDTLNLEYDELSLEQKKMKNRIGRDGATLQDAPRGWSSSNSARVNSALEAWAKNALGKPVTPADAAACDEYGISIASGTFDVALPLHGPTHGLQLVRNAMGTGLGSDGGFLAPEGFVPRLERALLSFAGTLQAAEIMTTDTGADLPWPTMDDTGNSGALLGEGNAATDSVDPKTGAVVFSAFMFTSNMVRVQVSLLEDNGVQLANVLGDMLGERIGRALNPYLTVGTGGSQPMGIVTGASQGLQTNSATTIQFDDLKDLEASVDPAYLGPGCGYMCHQQIFNVIKKLKDGDGRYLWQPNTQAGMPPTLNGWPVFLNQSMDSTISSGKKTVLFGKLDQYKVRRVNGVRLKRLVERYAEYDQEGFIAFARFDGALLDPGKRAVKYLIH